MTLLLLLAMVVAGAPNATLPHHSVRRWSFAGRLRANFTEP